MAPRTLRMLTCFSVPGGNVPLPVADQEAATHGTTKRRWSGEIKRKILASARRARVRAVKEEDVDPCDNVDVEKKRAPERKVVELRRPALRRGGSPRDDGAPEAISAVAAVGVRERKGLRVRFDLPGAEEASAVEPRFPTGVLGEAPESFAHSSPEMTAAFLMSVAAGAGRATAIDNELVARWTERKQACSRRLRYLRDHCPFHREDEEEEEEDEESEPETTTLSAERDHVHAKEVLATLKTTGLPLDSPEFEGEFVNAICSRYLLKDDFISRYGYGTESLVEV